jgi:hypothetical protein
MTEPMTAAQRDAYVGPPCPECGTAMVPDWHETTTFGSERTWVAGLHDCPNRRNHPRPDPFDTP